MTPQIQVEIKVSDGPLVSQRVEASAKRAGFREIGRRHARNILPRHTVSGAATKYGYAPRSRKYVKQAKKRNASWRPFFASGMAARSLREPVEPTATQYGGRLRPRVQLGSYSTALSGRVRLKKGQISLNAQQKALLMRAAEIQTVIPEEREEMAEAFQRGYASGIQGRRMVKVSKR